jgi:hypothetical protein
MNCEDRQSHRKVYARGYFDALRKLGIDPEEMKMQQAKFDSIHRGLSSIAKKVFEGVPIAEPWSASQIHNELTRLQICGCDLRTVTGCLNTLVEAGLAEEPQRGAFIRAQIRQKAPAPTIKLVPSLTKEPEMKPQPVATSNAPAETDPIDRLSGIAARVITVAETLRALASDIETAAIEIADRSEKRNDETKKLRQLQELLKSLA